MNGGAHNFDAAEIIAYVVAGELVVVAGDIDDPRALAGALQELLHDVIMGLRPIPARFQPPAVDDIADKIDRIGFIMLQKSEQHLGLTSLCAEVDVGQEHGSNTDDVAIFFRQVCRPYERVFLVLDDSIVILMTARSHVTR